MSTQMTLANLVQAAKAWCARNHTGERQHGHHGFPLGTDEHGNTLFVSCQEKFVWINVQEDKFDETGERQLPDRTVNLVRKMLKSSGLTIVDGWGCRSHGMPSYSWVGAGWEIHPTSIDMCRPIGIGKKAKILK